MKKILKIALVFVILLFCVASVANAATNEELIAYASKSFNVAGETVKLNDNHKRIVERYLKAHPVTNEQADKIIAKIDEGVKLMNNAGVSNPSKLSKTQKDQLFAIAKEAASIAGATLSYDSNSETIVIYYNGTVFDKVSVKTGAGLAQTGSDYSGIVYTIAGVAIVAVAAVAITRKNKVNAK